MQKRKCFAVLLALSAFGSGILSGCSTSRNMVFDGGKEDVEPQIPLTLFGFKYEALNVTAIEDALRGYMEEYPEVSISYDGIKSPEYFSVLERRIATGNGDDIFMVDHERALELESRGKLADLSGLSTLDGFSKLAKSQMFAHGHVNYVPTSISAFGLYCNVDLLKAHGQKIPENLEEFTSVCDYFVLKGIAPVVANNDISLKTVAIGKSMLPIYQAENTAAVIARINGGQDDLGEVLRPGFELVEQMLSRGWVDAETALHTAKTKDDITLFATGKQPFMLTGAWAVSRLREQKPGFQFEVRPYPIMEDGSVLVINVDTRISVNAESPHLEEARRFVEYITQKNVMWEFVDSQSSFSPLEENRLAEDQAIQSIGPYLTNERSVLGSDDNLEFPIWDMTRQCVVEMLKGSDSAEAVSHMKELVNEWRKAEEKGRDL